MLSVITLSVVMLNIAISLYPKIKDEPVQTCDVRQGSFVVINEVHGRDAPHVEHSYQDLSFPVHGNSGANQSGAQFSNLTP